MWKIRSNKITAWLIMLCMLTSMLATVGTPTAVYAATPEAPWAFEDDGGTITYLISSAADLMAVSDAVYKDYWTANFRQTTDITLPDLGAGVSNWTPIGSSFSNSFKGTFDGGGFTIYNLTIHNSTLEYVGLFGYVGSGARLENITLADVDIEAMYYFVIRDPIGAKAGALVGTTGSYTIISNCSSIGSVTGGDYAIVGGLAGNIMDGNISISYNTGSITGGNSALIVWVLMQRLTGTSMI